jgi:hypothetical protein
MQDEIASAANVAEVEIKLSTNRFTLITPLIFFHSQIPGARGAPGEGDEARGIRSLDRILSCSGPPDRPAPSAEALDVVVHAVEHRGMGSCCRESEGAHDKQHQRDFYQGHRTSGAASFRHEFVILPRSDTVSRHSPSARTLKVSGLAAPLG